MAWLIAWRTSFDRPAAIDALADAVQAVKLPVKKAETKGEAK
jgi:hypothetical protein